METEVETGGRWPPAQGWTPGAPSPGMDAQSHQPRDGCPEPPEAGRGWEGASGQRSALGHPDLRHLVSRARGGRIPVVLIPQCVVICYGCTQTVNTPVPHI